jgi:hypothetical protein
VTRAFLGARKPVARGLALGCVLLLAVLLGRPSALHAEEAAREPSRTLEYQAPAEKYYLRALLEELGLFGAGLGYYFAEQQTNSIDWALNYDWLSFRRKLTCEACKFDQNFFDTNFLTHPAAGTLYYLAARGNRLSVLESFAYALAMSSFWEFVGEFRERVSVNDFFVTPISGLVLGESTTQLGAFFDRGCPTLANEVLGSVFAPSKALHDALDGAVPARDAACDAHGLSTGGRHRLRVWAGGAAVWTQQTGPAVGEARFGADASIEHLDTRGKPGRGWLTFSDGNVSSLSARMSLEPGHVSDLRIGARVVPTGLHYRDLAATRGEVVGHELVFGLLLGTEYALHRRTGAANALDRVFLVDAPAATVGWLLRGTGFSLDVALDAGATLAGVSAFALGEYKARYPTSDLAGVTRLQGYSHALGLALAPRARLELENAELGFEGRSDRFFALRVLDPGRDAHGMTPIFESRRRGELWLAVGPPGGLPRARFFVDGYQRSGVTGEAQKSLDEVALGASLDGTF